MAVDPAGLSQDELDFFPQRAWRADRTRMERLHAGTVNMKIEMNGLQPTPSTRKQSGQLRWRGIPRDAILLLVIAPVGQVACSDPFTSCESTQTCPSSGGPAGSGGRDAAAGESAGGNSAAGAPGTGAMNSGRGGTTDSASVGGSISVTSRAPSAPGRRSSASTTRVARSNALKNLVPRAKMSCSALALVRPGTSTSYTAGSLAASNSGRRDSRARLRARPVEG
jgi:hypothetical protein